MKFQWSNEEFALTPKNTVLKNCELYVHDERIRQAFEDHFYVVVSELSLETSDDSEYSVLCAKLDYSVQYGEEVEYLSDVVFLTDDEWKLLA